MKQKNYLLKLWMLLLCVVAGVGNVWGEETLYYTLDGTITTGGNSNYAQDGGGLTQNDIEWSVTGNTTINPWRIGGKNLTNVNREAYSKTAMGAAISKIELEIGSITLTTCNSIKLVVASDASFSTELATITKTDITANATLTFSSETTEWASGAYYKFIFNVTAGSSNSYVQLKSAKFYKASSSGGGDTPSLQTSDLSLSGAPVALSFDLYNNSSAQTVSYTTSSTGAVTVSESEYVSCVVDETAKTITVNPTAVTPSAQTITVSQEADDTYAAGTATFTVTITDSTPAPTYTVTLGDDNTTLTQETGGTAVTLPTRNNIDNYTFAGWSETNVNTKTTTAPTIIPSGAYTPTADITLYPVYTCIESSGENHEEWVEVYTKPEDGTYVICSQYYFMSSTITSNRFDNGYDINNHQVPEISNGKLVVAPNNNCIWEIYKMQDGTYRIKQGEKYAAAKSSNNQGQMLSSETDSNNYTVWNINYTNSEFSIPNKGKSGKYLRNNSGNGWAPYNSDTGHAPRLFKKTTSAATTTYYWSNPIADTRAEAGISFAKANVSIESTESYTGQELTNPHNVSPITWTSSNENVATVEDGTISMVAPGETTITAAFAGNESYKPATVSYTLTINAHIPVLSSIALSGEYPQTFFVGDEFSHEGMMVTATYDDNSTQDVTSSATFTGYEMNTAGEQTVTVSYTEGDITKTATYTITVNELPKYTVTFSDGGSVTQASAGEAVTLPTRDAIGEYSFAGWSEANVSEETTTVPTIIPAGSYTPTADITLYPVYTRSEGGSNTDTDNVFSSGSYDEMEGTITWSVNGVASITQEQNTGATAPNSDYVSSPRWYSGNKITITPSVSINTITITATSDSYATALKNSTYTNATASASGTEVTITPTNGNNAITIVMGGQSRLSSLVINYGGGTTYYWSSPVAAAVERPMIEVANTFNFSTTATITCATEGATIYYRYSENEDWTEYTTALTITETTTIYAKAVKGNDESAVASKTITKEKVAPTVTVSGELTLDLDGETNVSAGTLNAAVTYNETAVNGATVTWRSSDSDIATIDPSTGAVTLVATGEVTFTATYAGNSDYSEATGTKTVTVINSKQPGTLGKPYKVAEAIDAIDNDRNVTDVYVTGIVSQVDEYNSSYHSITYWISEDGTTTSSQFEVYSGKGIGGANFSSIDDIQVGDQVVVKGSIKKYNDVYEFNYNNQLVSLTRKPAATITVTNGTQQTIDLTQSQEMTLTASANSGATVVFTLDSENTTLTGGTDFDFEDGEFVFYTTKGGVIVVKANAPAAGDYLAAEEVTITITVIGEKTDATIVVQDSEVAYGSTFIVDDTMIQGGAITITSSNTSVATVEGLVITPVAVGTTIITVATAEDANHKAGSEAFTLTVTAPEGGTTAYVAEATTATLDFTTNSWNMPTSNTTGTESYSNGTYTVTVYAPTNYKLSSDYLFLGRSGAYIALPAFDKPVTQIDVTGTSGASQDVKQNIFVTVDGEDVAVSTETKGAKNVTNKYAIAEEYQAAGNIYKLKVTSSHNTQITTIVVHFASEPIEVTLASSGYASYCCQYPLDFTNNDKNTYRAWYVSNVEGTQVTFTEITGKVKGGTPIILYGTPNAKCQLASADCETGLTNNLLEGTLAPTYVVSDDVITYFGLSNGQFVKMKNGTVKANKAFLPILTSQVPTGSNARLDIVFSEETDGIKSIENGQLTIDNSVYDLQGRRVETMKKGSLYIVNGKKFVSK